MITEFNLSNFTLRYLTRLGLMPIVKTRIEEHNNGNLIDFIKHNSFHLAGIFYWKRTPEGHSYWHVLKEKIDYEYKKISTNKITKT